MTVSNAHVQVASITAQCFAAGTTAARWAFILRRLRHRFIDSDTDAVSSPWESTVVSDAILQLILDAESSSYDAVGTYVCAACTPAVGTVEAGSSSDHDAPLMQPQDLTTSLAKATCREAIHSLSSRADAVELTLASVQRFGSWGISDLAKSRALMSAMLAESSKRPHQVLAEAQKLIASFGGTRQSLTQMGCIALAEVLIPAVSAVLAESTSADSDSERAPTLDGAQNLLTALQAQVSAAPQLATIVLEVLARLQELLVQLSPASIGSGTQSFNPATNTSSPTAQSASSSFWARSYSLPTSRDAFGSLAPSDVIELQTVAPEIAILVTKLVEPQLSWSSKLALTKALLRARCSRQESSKSKCIGFFWFEVLQAALLGCAFANLMSSPDPGSRNRTSLWRSGLCCVVPAVMQHFSEGEEFSLPDFDRVVKALFIVSEETMGSTGGPELPTTDAKNGAHDGDATMQDGTPPSAAPSMGPLLLRSLLEKGLVSQTLTSDPATARASQVNLSSLGATLSTLSSAQGSSMHALAEQRITSEAPQAFMDQIRYDYSSQDLQARLLALQFERWMTSKELDTAAQWARALVDECGLLDVVVSHTSVDALLKPVAQWLVESGLDNSAEDNTSLGSLILFAQLLIKRYNVTDNSYRALSHTFRSSSWSRPLHGLSPQHAALVDRWITALFDSDGISDDLLRESPPRILLLLAPTLFAQSIATCQSGVIDLELLRNGLTYFLEDPLSYTLPGALLWLLNEVHRTPVISSKDQAGGHAHRRIVLLEVLGMLLDAEKCPPAVQALVGGEMLSFGLRPESQTSMQGSTTGIDPRSLKHKLKAAYADNAYLSSDAILTSLLQMTGQSQPAFQRETWASICTPRQLSPTTVLASLGSVPALFNDNDVKCAASCVLVIALTSHLGADSVLRALAAHDAAHVGVGALLAVLAASQLIMHLGEDGTEQLDKLLLLSSLHICRLRARKAMDPLQIGALRIILTDDRLRQSPKYQAVLDAINAPDPAFEGL